jgi:hypothetical protein
MRGVSPIASTAVPAGKPGAGSPVSRTSWNASLGEDWARARNPNPPRAVIAAIAVRMKGLGWERTRASFHSSI